MRQSITAESRLNGPAKRLEPLPDLAGDDRAFDEALTRSALDYVNGTWGVGPNAADPDAALAWVPGITLERYRRAAGIGAKPIKPKPFAPSDSIKAQLAVTFAINSLPRWRLERSSGRPAPGEASSFEWINTMLRELPLISYWQVGRDGLQTITVPALQSAEHCIAYAVACIAGNRWGMADRVDYCAFVPAGDAQRHLFVAESLKQRYCCKAHQNAHAQRRSKQRARKHQ